jgi:hypothetical protein
VIEETRECEMGCGGDDKTDDEQADDAVENRIELGGVRPLARFSEAEQ